MNFITQYMMFGSSILAHKPPSDEAVFTIPGTYTWTAPPQVRSVSVVCIGGGASPTVELLNFPGGGGGGLAYANDIPVVPGQQYTVIVGSGGETSGYSLSSIAGEDGGNSSFDSPEITVVGYGGLRSGIGGTHFGDGGGNGGPANGTNGYGGGGAGGYSGNGGAGGPGAEGGSNDPRPLVYPSGGGGNDGTGGAGGGGGGSLHTKFVIRGHDRIHWNGAPIRGSSGGGTGIFGQTNNGKGSVSGAQWDPLSSSPPLPASPAEGGSDGEDGDNHGGAYGGGGRAGFFRVDKSLYLGGGKGGGGAVRIIWPGDFRQFPSINTQEI